MSLLTLENVSLAYGHHALLEQVRFSIEKGERIGLVGRNGAGKSSLMRLIAGEIEPDDGEIRRSDELRIAWLPQEIPTDERCTVFELVADGLGDIGELIARYHQTALELAQHGGEELMNRLTTLQEALESADGWRLEQRVETVLSRLGLPADRLVEELSGGYQRRAVLARALVTEPDLLLLDEPTNHLDIDSITWLEELLSGYSGTLLFITHDRAFLQRLATTIAELDRGCLTRWPGDYGNYLRRREERLSVEAEHNVKFDKNLAREEEWIRQGIKARRTRNEGRVRALEQLRRERSRRRELQGRAKLSLNEMERSGRLVLEARGVSKAWDGRPVVQEFSTRIMRGDRIGIVGPNGAGKSTLIKLLLGEMEPDSGSVRRGTKLQIAYFDQQRDQLDPEKSVIDNVAAGSDRITINGKQRHIIGYLQDFLFPPQRARSPVGSLSGGERSRLLLARLFTRPANLLIMDEPTNDLDIETLELLEELLNDYRGTLLLVSHDRTFLDNVVTSTLVFEGEGRIGEYVGGYRDWVRQRRAAPEKRKKVSLESRPIAAQKRSETTKLSYKLQRELDSIPGRIEELEQKRTELHKEIAKPDFYRQPHHLTTEKVAELTSVEQRLEKLYERWEELEN